jgi:phosphoribosylformimino-5-aminoimidazole carboxamide ribotide isomerase
MMELIPAIDIRGGKCVQLAQGDYARETVFADDPVAAARGWRDRGATRLHVVDLDGAREGRPVNTALVGRIVRAVAPVPVQCGGGVRNPREALMLRDLGVARVIVGTAAVEDLHTVARLVEELGEALIVSIDARDGIVMTHGWLKSGDVPATDLAEDLAAAGVARFVYTDISRDGMLQGPNIDGLRAFIEAAERPVIASGGIVTIEHLRNVAAAGAEAAISGTALYTGALNFEAALAALREAGTSPQPPSA